MIIPKFKGRIENNKLVVYDKDYFKTYLSQMKGSDVSIVIKKYRADRTQQQNKYLFGVVYKLISEASGMDIYSVHSGMKNRFLSYEHNNLIITRSTTDLDTKEFSEYIQKIDEFCFEFFNFHIPPAEKIDF